MTNHAVVLSIYIITFLIGLPTNLLSLHTFLVKVGKDPAPIDNLLLNLALSDFVLLVFLPLKMAEGNWPFPNVLCTVTSCIFHSNIYISVLLLMAISVDRFLGAGFPIKYRLTRKPTYAVVASVFIWLLVGSHSSSVYIVGSMSTNANETVLLPSNHVACFKVFDGQQKKILYPLQLEICIVLFCIPFAITSFCHINVIRLLANVKGRCKRRCKVLAVVTWLIFVICFIPFNVAQIWGTVNDAGPEWRDYSFALGAISICMDPFVFFFSSNPIRKNAGIWYRRCQHVIRQCSVACRKDTKGKGEGADRLSTLNRLAETGVGTVSSSAHPPCK